MICSYYSYTVACAVFQRCLVLSLVLYWNGWVCWRSRHNSVY